MPEFVRLTLSGTTVLAPPGADLAVLVATPKITTATSAESGGSLAHGTHWFVLTSLDDQGGETAPSDPVAAVVAGPSAQVTLSWTVDPAAAGGYRVYHGTARGEYVEYVAVSPLSGTLVFTGSGTTTGYPPADSSAVAFRLGQGASLVPALTDHLLVDDGGSAIADDAGNLLAQG